MGVALEFWVGLGVGLGVGVVCCCRGRVLLLLPLPLLLLLLLLLRRNCGVGCEGLDCGPRLFRGSVCDDTW